MKQQAQAAKKAKALAKGKKSSILPAPSPTHSPPMEYDQDPGNGGEGGEAKNDHQSQSEYDLDIQETSSKEPLPDKPVPSASTTLVSMTFDSLGLITPLLDAVKQLGYTKPTEIQAGIIPHALEGKDVIGVAETVSTQYPGNTSSPYH